MWEPLQRRWVFAEDWPAAAGSPLKRLPQEQEIEANWMLDPSASERCARPTRNLRVRKSRRGSPSGPVAQARRPTGKSPRGAGHGWPAVFAETGCRIGNLRWGADPGRRPLIHGGGSRPPFRVAEAWPRG